jgi:hypothetical protein
VAVLRALLSAVVALLALPGVAVAGTASVVPFVEPPDIDAFGSCSRYMNCPPDMLVFTAAAGESNQLTIAPEEVGSPDVRWRVQDAGAALQAGPGCEQVDSNTAVCRTRAVGPVQLGDGDDRTVANSGRVSGGDGQDVISVQSGEMEGDEDDDVLIGSRGQGGGGDDLLTVTSGEGQSGDDTLRCFPRGFTCHLDGGPGDDLLTGGTSIDRLFGRAGHDVLRGGADFDSLWGGRGDDRLVGGAGGDHLRGQAGADRLESREDRSAGEAIVLDRVDCGAGRRDRAVADRRDDVKRCERGAR